MEGKNGKRTQENQRNHKTEAHHMKESEVVSWIKSVVGLVTWVVPGPSPIDIKVFEWFALNFLI